MDLNDKKEKLSLLIDDELSSDEKPAFIEALSQDEELKKTWQIYHMIKNAIKRKRDSYRDFEQPAVVHTQTMDKQDSKEHPGSS